MPADVGVASATFVVCGERRRSFGGHYYVNYSTVLSILLPVIKLLPLCKILQRYKYENWNTQRRHVIKCRIS